MNISPQRRHPAWAKPFLQFTGWSRDLTDALWYARVSIFTLLLLFGALWVMNQGHDIIVSMAERWQHAVLTYLLTTVLGLLNWYFPRLIFPANAGRFKRLMVILRELRTGSAGYLWNRQVAPCGHESHTRIFGIARARKKKRDQNKLYALLPRFLGVFTVVLVAAAVFRLWLLSKPDNYEMLNGKLLGSSGFHFLLAMAVAWAINRLTYHWRHRLCPGKVLFPVLGILAAIVAGLAVFTNEDIGLAMLALGLLLVAIILSIFFTLRTINPWMQRYLTDAVITIGLALVTAILSVTFIVHNLLGSAAAVFPFVVILCAIIFYLTIIHGLLLTGQRLNAYLLNLVIIILFLLASLWDVPLHDIKPIAGPPPARMTMSDYIDRWLSDRSAEIEARYAADSLPYPIFVVAGEGGGSRAAYWTNLVLSTLEDQSRGAFSRHCFGITAASGSSFGSAAFLAHLSERSGQESYRPIVDETYHRSTFERNYLSTSLAMFLGADFWRTVLPFTYYIGSRNDRAVALEREWSLGVERALQQDTTLTLAAGKGRFQQPFRSFWYDDSGRVNTGLPLFIPNTTSVLKGTRGIVSPVRFDTAIQHNAIDLQASLDGNEDLSMATATLLSARFPLVNPAGQLKDRDQFVDGGYYDNLGGTTAYELIGSLRRHLATRPDSLRRRLAIHLLLIFNNDYRPAMLTKRPVLQLIAPVTALANTPFSGHTEYWAEKLTSEADLTDRLYLDHSLTLDGKRVIMPLARYLSKSAAEGIRRNVLEGSFDGKNNGEVIRRIVEGLDRSLGH